jgi:hypothetical protein
MQENGEDWSKYLQLLVQNHEEEICANMIYTVGHSFSVFELGNIED